MSRNTSADGFKNKLGSFFLTRFKPVWSLIQKVPWLRARVNRRLLRNAILKTKTRPHQFSLRSDYTTWSSLTDRVFTGRHLPPSAEFNASLPPLEDVVNLFRRTPESYRESKKSTVLFTHFAQWFTDGFLRTVHPPSNDQNLGGTNGETAEEEYFRRNTSNHEIDLCQIYGLNEGQQHQLREHKGGRLKTSTQTNGEYPPLYFDAAGNPKEEFNKVEPLLPPRLPPDRKKFIFVGGVERVNVQIGYAMYTTLFLREHNRICTELSKAYPEWKDDDERLFQTARNILIVILLRIVIEEYINHITPYHFKFFLDASGNECEKWYRTNWMTVEFNLLYRWHSMVPDSVILNGKHEKVSESLFNNSKLIERGLGLSFCEASRQRSSELGLLNTTEALLDTERKALEIGRKSHLKSYNDYRELFSFPRVTTFDQITGNERIRTELERVYRNVDNIELFAGLFAEDVRENSALSPLIGRMVGVDAFSQALTNPLLSANVYNEATFSKLGMQIIEETNSVTQLLHRNLGDDTKTYQVNFTQDGDEIAYTADIASEIGAKAERSDQARERSFSDESSASFDERDLYKK